MLHITTHIKYYFQKQKTGTSFVRYTITLYIATFEVVVVR